MVKDAKACAPLFRVERYAQRVRCSQVSDHAVSGLVFDITCALHAALYLLGRLLNVSIS